MATKLKEKPVDTELIEFYRGKVVIEKKPWREHFSYRRQGEKDTLLSVTAITKKLDKSGALLPWAVGLVATHINQKIELSEAQSFSKEEIRMLVDEARRKPEEAKISGGTTGELIHTFAHDFAKAKLAGTETPTLKHLREDVEEEAKAINGISAFLDWYNGNDVEFLEMEKLVYYNSLLAGDTKKNDPIREFIGILDLRARVNGKLAIIDYKSSKGVYSEQQYQLTGYRKAKDKEFLFLGKKKELADVELIVNFNKLTGELITKEITDEDSEKNWHAFLGLYAVAVREKQLSKY